MDTKSYSRKAIPWEDFKATFNSKKLKKKLMDYCGNTDDGLCMRDKSSKKSSRGRIPTKKKKGSRGRSKSQFKKGFYVFLAETTTIR